MTENAESCFDPPTAEWAEIGGLRQRFLSWSGTGSGPAYVLLHGWLDLAEGFEALAQRLRRMPGIGRVYALDFRGHGHSEWVGRGGYYHFQDYVRDVHGLTRAVEDLRRPFHLLGHSMGGTVATYMAGSFPKQVLSLTLLEGSGPRGLQPEQSPARTRRWLDQLERGVSASRLRDLDDASDRLQAAHPGLAADLIRTMADAASVVTPEGRRWRYDPLHRTQSPTPFTSATYISYAQAYRGEVLHVHGRSSWMVSDAEAGRIRRESAFAGQIERQMIAGAGHMLHLSHAGAVADAITDWRRVRNLAQGADPL